MRNSDFQAREAQAERVRVSLRYDTGKDGRLEMRAYYDSDSLAFEPIAATSVFDIDRKDEFGELSRAFYALSQQGPQRAPARCEARCRRQHDGCDRDCR